MNKLESIRKFKEWKNSWSNQDSFGIFEYVSYNVHPDDVLIISNLFFPQFIEYEGGIFFKEKFDIEIYNQAALTYNKKDIERTMNSIHVYDIFAYTDNVDEDTYVNVGNLLKLVWSNHLSREYPNRHFKVDLIISEQEYGPILRIFQIT